MKTKSPPDNMGYKSFQITLHISKELPTPVHKERTLIIQTPHISHPDPNKQADDELHRIYS